MRRDLIDILLPGIDGATLITSLRPQERLRHCRLVVLTSLDEAQRGPYRFALEGLPVIHKTDVVRQLPPLLKEYLPAPMAGASA